MAVADLGVAVGPRNRRRLTKSAVGLAAIAAIAATVVLLNRPTSPSATGSSAGAARLPAPAFVTDRLVYGMSKKQVLHRVGQPTKIVGACWEYRLNEKIRNGQNTLNAERVCFVGGVYSYSYSRIDGKWFYPTTPLTVQG